MRQLIDVVFRLTGSPAEFPSTVAHNRLEFSGFLPWTHHLYGTVQAYTLKLFVPCSLEFISPSLRASSETRQGMFLIHLFYFIS